MSSWGGGRLYMVLLVACALFGCHSNERKELHYLGDHELKYYKDQATEIAYPQLCNEPETREEVTTSDVPRMLYDRRRDEVWDMPLVEALHTAMANNRVIRTNQSFLAQFLSNNSPSVYDSAIQESNVLFGGRGVEAALSDFDTTFTTSAVWGRDETNQNSIFAAGATPGGTLQVDSANFEAALQKQFANGSSLRVVHDWQYQGVNLPSTAEGGPVLFPSSYRGTVRAEYRHPLWAGSGTEYTRIAGPTNPNFSAITGVSQGVVIARINQDITLADFEESVRTMLKDVEDLYWDLYLAYRNYDTAVFARNSALRTWRDAKAKLDVGGAPGFEPADEAQARDQYYANRALAEQALNTIYTTEIRLRRILGLAVNDGRIIRPADEPPSAEFVPDWYACLAEALTQRLELRRQKWNIKSLELQLIAAESLTNPRLDFITAYRVNGFGDRLIDYNDNDGASTQGLASAYETLTQGDQTGWNLGFEFSMPIGFRAALTQVRNIEWRLTKAHEVLALIEQDISHELATSFQNLVTQYATAQSNFNRMMAARRRVELFEAKLGVGTVTYDLVLRAQASLADAESSYYTSLANYAKAIAEVHLRKGTLLEHDNVYLAEDGWTPEAYQDALDKAWQRSTGIDAPWMYSEPPEFELDVPVQRVGFVPGGAVEPEGANPGELPLPPTPSQGVTPVEEFELPTTPAPLPPAPGADEADLNDAPPEGVDPFDDSF